LLNKEGVSATQATVSRDIKKLGLVKVKGVTKNFKYALPPKTEKNIVTEDKVITLLKTFIVSIERARNLVVIKTLEGNGSACGMAVDKIGMKEIIGSIAGDDTLLIVSHTDEDAEIIVKHFKDIVGL
jgi:transcriptional regulator of arginine metabolism